MRTLAVTLWNNQVSPLFESALNIAVFDEGPALPETISWSDKSLLDKIALLRAMQVPVLICGAISGFSLKLLSEHGINVVPWIRGPVREVVAAYRDGTLTMLRSYVLPGCAFRRRGRGPGNGGRFCRRQPPPTGGIS